MTMANARHAAQPRKMLGRSVREAIERLSLDTPGAERLRIELGWVLAFGHTVMFVLGCAGRLAYSIPPDSRALALFAGDAAQAVFHFVPMALLIVAQLQPGKMLSSRAASASFAVFMMLGFTNAVWAMQVDPVSLMLPAASLIFGLVAQRLSASWEDSADVRDSR